VSREFSFHNVSHEVREARFNKRRSTEMVRLLDASIALNNWAGALNMFTLWLVSGTLAGLIFALCAEQSRLAVAAEAV
jgi:hypothetical protein